MILISDQTDSYKFFSHITKGQASKVLQVVGGITSVILFTLGIINVSSLHPIIRYGLIIAGAVNLLLILAIRRGYLILASIIQFSSILLLLEFSLVNGNGIHDIAVIGFPIVMLLGVLLWGKNAIPYLTLTIIGLTGFLIRAEITGVITTPYSEHTEISSFTTFSIFMIITAAVLYFIDESLQQNLNLARHSEVRWRSLVENAPTIIINSDETGRILFINRPLWNSESNFLGESIYDLLPEASAQSLQETVKEVLHSKQPGSIEIKAIPNQDQVANYSVQVGLTDMQHPSGGLTYIITDVSEKVRTRNFLEHMATHDLLTNLPNRLLFYDRLSQDIAQAKRHNTNIAVMLLDLDDFKLINDAYSHEDGDKLLRILAKRLQQTVRGSDTIARLGGDEFALIITELNTPEDAYRVAEKILDTISESVTINDREIFTTCSLGISMYPKDGELIPLLIQNADIAMYQAKNAGKSKIEFYFSDLTEEVVTRLNVAKMIRQALEQDTFLLEYQPQYNLHDHTIVGLEALIRMRGEGDTLIPPNEFISVAEKSGLIIQIGEWVLDTVSGLASNLDDKGLHPIKIAVNLSERQWQDKFLVEKVSEALHRSRLPAHLLEIEITENSMFRNIEDTQKTMHNLKSLGVRLAIDDFGKGSSSLGYLGTLPVDAIKIDTGFTQEVLTSDQTRSIVTGIIKISQELGLEIIVEGVETKDQLDFFKSQGCSIVQGWYFSPSVPHSELPKLLKNNHSENGTIP